MSRNIYVAMLRFFSTNSFVKSIPLKKIKNNVNLSRVLVARLTRYKCSVLFLARKLSSFLIMTNSVDLTATVRVKHNKGHTARVFIILVEALHHVKGSYTIFEIRVRSYNKRVSCIHSVNEYDIRDDYFNPFVRRR